MPINGTVSENPREKLMNLYKEKYQKGQHCYNTVLKCGKLHKCQP